MVHSETTSSFYKHKQKSKMKKKHNCALLLERLNSCLSPFSPVTSESRNKQCLSDAAQSRDTLTVSTKPGPHVSRVSVPAPVMPRYFLCVFCSTTAQLSAKPNAQDHGLAWPWSDTKEVLNALGFGCHCCPCLPCSGAGVVGQALFVRSCPAAQEE